MKLNQAALSSGPATRLIGERSRRNTVGGRPNISHANQPSTGKIPTKATQQHFGPYRTNRRSDNTTSVNIQPQTAMNTNVVVADQ